MRIFGHRVIVFCGLAVAALSSLAASDGITLTLDRNLVPDEVVLEWFGGTGTYRVFRSGGATAVTVTANLLGQTSMTTWTDTFPPAGIAFYHVTGAPNVFRITDLDLMDPHVFSDALIICLDVTAVAFNSAIQDQIDGDSDLDGLLDLSALMLFRPLDPNSPGGTAEFGLGDCTLPPDTVCDQDLLDLPVPANYSNVTTGSCLAPHPGTTSGYSPAIVSTDAPPTCFVSVPESIVLDLAGVGIPLQDFQLSANYVGDPADSLINGLLRGFIAESVADTLLVDPGTGEMPLSSLLPGGTGNCASGDDRDIGLDGSTIGWWLYFNFAASETDYIGP